MTKESKIEWLNNATNEELLNQMRWSAVETAKASNIAMQIEAEEDLELAMNELLKRLEKNS